MKLRNKKTGQIGNFIINKDHFECVDLDYVPEYRNITELNAEWEDYEEPKEYWYLNEYLELDHEIWTDTEFDNKLKSIGNYFGTEEEAELAVQKLKAWKRLKDKSFKFYSYYLIAGDDDETKVSGKLGLSAECLNHVDRKDLDLLFGGEE